MNDIWLQGIVQCVPGFDAAYLPNPVPAGFGWCEVYAGGSSALHPWPDTDIQKVALAGLPILPVWVPTPSSDDPVKAAGQFIEWLDDHHVPVDTAVMPDMETATGLADDEWLDRFCDVLAAPAAVRGAAALNYPYGSAGSVFGLPARSGYVVADWTGSPHLFQAEKTVACQYAAGIVTGADFTIDPERTAARRRAAAPGEIDLNAAIRPFVGRMWRP